MSSLWTRRSPSGRAVAACALAAFLGAAPAALRPALAAEAATPASRPILVSIDDLPIATPKWHRDAEDRKRLTRDLLAVLLKHRVPAVGLVTWKQVQGPADEALLERWLQAGLELGNHSFGHLDYPRTPIDDYLADLEKGRAGLQSFLEARGKGPVRFFRFPFLREGDTEDKLQAARAYLDKSHQRVLQVTIDDQDWSFEEDFVTATRDGDRDKVALVMADYQAMLRQAVRHHEANGDVLFERRVPQIILLHANSVGAAGWDAFFSWLEATGHRFASADEVLKDPAFSEPQQFVARYGCSLWDRLAHARQEQEAREAIGRLLEEQSAAWSRGDLEAFCSGYADDALYLSPSGPVRGRPALVERYRLRYPDTKAMGTLRLEVEELRPVWGMEVTPAGDAVPGDIHGATVAARWTLSYPDAKDATGRTLLVFRRLSGRWVIVQDASF